MGSFVPIEQVVVNSPWCRLLRTAGVSLLLLLASFPLLASAEVRVAAIGDYGEEGAPLQSVADLIGRMDPDLVITLGDNSYDATPIDNNIGQYFSEYIGEYIGAYGPGAADNRFFPCLGNHDYSDGGGLPAYLEYFTIPGDSVSSSSGNERYYDFVHGPIQFFVVNSNAQEPDGRDSTSVQAQWLRAGLAASTAAWKIVYFHHSAYSSAEQHGSTEIMQWPFEAWGASAVLGGHDHTYERLLVGGIPYFVNGLGGRSLRGFGTTLPESQVRFSSDYGAMLISAEESWIEFQMRTVTGDSLVDLYRIERHAPRLSLTATQLDFTDTFVTTTSSLPLALENAGTMPLQVQELGIYGSDSTAFFLAEGTARKRPDGGAMLAATVPYSLPVGGRMNHTILFTPAAPRLYSAVLRIVSNDPGRELLEVPLQGTGLPPPEPEIAVSATEFDFGDVVRLSSVSQVLRIRNVGNLGMTVLSLLLQGEGASEFSLESQATPFSIWPGDSTSVLVEFTPRTFGSKNAWLQVQSNDPQTGILVIPLSGGGIPPNEPYIEVPSDSLVFAPVPTGGLATTNLPIRNQGALTLQVTAFFLTGPEADQFHMESPAVPFSIAAIDSSEISLQFGPTSRGTKRATLQIMSNDPNQDTLQVSLSGLGLEADIAIGSSEEDFGAVFVSEVSSWRSLTLSNEGNADLNVDRLEITGPDSSSFQMENVPTPFVLPGAGQFLIEARFAPTKSGALHATLGIHSDDPDESFTSISLAGTGVPAADVHVFYEESVTGESTGSNAVTTTSALTAVAGQLYVATIASKPLENVGSVSGLGLDWTRVQAQCGARGQTGLDVWIGQGTVETGTVTATFDNSPSSASLIVSRYSGADLQMPIGSTVSANTFGVAGACDGGSDSNSYALDLPTQFDESLVFAAVSMRNRVHTPDPGFTLRDESRAGSGGNMVSLDVMDQHVPSPETLAIEGSFSGDVDWSVIAIEIRATSPEIQVDPMAQDFGDLPVGMVATADFEIRNVGATDLEVPGIRIDGTDAADFLVTSGAIVPTLPPGASHVLRLQWAPVSAGTKTAVLDIVSNDRANTVLEIPLQGRAVTPTPAIAAAPTSIDFGSVAPQTQATDTVVLRNVGDAALDVWSIVLVGTDSLAFSLTPPALPLSLAPGDSTAVLVTFAPLDTGSKSAALRIESNSLENPVLQVPLTGEGVVPIDTQVVFEESVQGSSTSSSTVVTGGGPSAVTGDLYLAAMSSKGYFPVTSVEGMGLVWTPVRSQCAGRQQTGVDLWMGMGTPIEGPVTATFSGTPSNAVIVVSRYSGADPVEPLGTMVGANTNGTDGDCSGGSDNTVFSLDVATSGEDAVVFAAVALRYRQLSPGAGYVLRGEAYAGLGGSAAGLAVIDQEFPAGGIVPLNGSFDGSVDWAVVGIEIHPRKQALSGEGGPGLARETRMWLSSGVAGVAPWVECSVAEALPARVRLFDVRGRLVNTLWNGALPAGRRRFLWHGKNERGESAAAGVYFVLAELGHRTFRGKLVLLH